MDHSDPLIYGRCFAVPSSEYQITEMVINSSVNTDIRFHSPGNWYDEEFKYWHFENNTEADVDISYEIFEVLDFDGEDCGHYHLTGETRDDCVKNHMKNQTLEKVGCFTPFFGDKSNICCSETESKRALEIYNDLIDKAWTGQIKECPKPCKFLMIDFSRSSKFETWRSAGQLIIKFRKFIKYSKVSFTYQGLELFAEFGGYLGLLLGMSLNQVPHLISALINTIKNLFVQTLK